MPEFWKKFKSEPWASAETFPGEGQTRCFAYRFNVADDAMQKHIKKVLCPIYTIRKMPPATQRRNEGARRAQFLERRITMGALDHCREWHKVPTMSQIPFSIQYIWFWKDLRFEHGGAEPASCPGCHLTCWLAAVTTIALLAQQLFFFIHASFHTAQYKTTKLTAITSHCLAAFSANDICVEQSHAAKRLRS